MREITASELKEMLDQGDDVLMVDVREPYEHEDFNIGGILIPLGDLSLNIERLKESGDKEIVLYCRSGNRSAMAQKLLAIQYNITNTINLKGGILAWKENEKMRE